jgi:hypothetical protein
MANDDMANTARTDKAACRNKGEKITAWSTPFGGTPLARPRFAGENGLFTASPQERDPWAGSGSIENFDMAAS